MADKTFTAEDLHFAVVVYNKCCKYSVTCHTLMAQSCKGFDVYIVDNSTKDFNNEDYCREIGWKYVSMHGNAGLSKAYNHMLGLLGNSSGYVVWCDDDSSFSENYVENTLRYINRCHNEFQVYAPLVYAGEKIYSPNTIKPDGFAKRITSLDELDKDRIAAINSGLVVSLDAYKNYRYDIGMFLDYIDHDFSLFCLRSGIRIKFMKHSVIHQNSFFEGKPSPEKLKIRRKIYKNDFLRFVKRNDLNMVKGYKKYYNGKILQILKQLLKG